MLASIFIIQGLERRPAPRQEGPAAEPVVRPIAERASFVPDDVEQVVRLNGAVQLVAGSMLALGRVPRLSALAIAASLLPTTYAGHRFWETDDKQERTQQRIHFLKNVSIFGGLLIAAADTGGNPSLAWRGRHAVSSAKRDVALAAKSAKAQARTAKTSAKVAKDRLRRGQGGRQGGRQVRTVGQPAANRLIRGPVAAGRVRRCGGRRDRAAW